MAAVGGLVEEQVDPAVAGDVTRPDLGLAALPPPRLGVCGSRGLGSPSGQGLGPPALPGGRALAQTTSACKSLLTLCTRTTPVSAARRRWWAEFVPVVHLLPCGASHAPGDETQTCVCRLDDRTLEPPVEAW